MPDRGMPNNARPGGRPASPRSASRAASSPPWPCPTFRRYVGGQALSLSATWASRWSPRRGAAADRTARPSRRELTTPARSQRVQVALRVGADRASAVASCGGRHRQVELAEQGRAGAPEDPGQGAAVRRGVRCPQGADAPRRVGDGRDVRLGGADDHVRPGEGAGHQQQAAAGQVRVAVVVLDDAQRRAVVADRRVQVAQQGADAAVGELLEPVGDVGVQQRLQPRPVRRDRRAPVPVEGLGHAPAPAPGRAASPRSSRARSARRGPGAATGWSARCRSCQDTAAGSAAVTWASAAGNDDERRAGEGTRKSGM